MRPGREPGRSLVRRAPRPRVRWLADRLRGRLRRCCTTRARCSPDLGDVGDTRTRWADWIDLLTPYVVTGAAAGALRGGGASRGTWTLFWFADRALHPGAGHPPGREQHQQRGPGRRGAGVPLGRARRALPLVRRLLPGGGRARGGAGRPAAAAAGSARTVLALLVGFTTFTNSVEGQTPWLGIGASVVFAGWGLLTRDGMGRLLLTAYAFAGLLFLVFGIWQGGFPEFSELGWI